MVFGSIVLAAIFLFQSSAIADVAPDAAPLTAPAGAMPSPFQFILGTVNFFLIAFFVYYILVLRPTQQKQEEQQRFVKGLKNGDAVITSGGILGRVSAVSPEYITVEVAPGMKLRVTPDHVFGPDGKSASAEPKAIRPVEKEKKAK